MLESKVTSRLDPCILISSKFYYDGDDVYVKNQDIIEENAKSESNFDYGAYIIQFQSEKEKEIEALGQNNYLDLPTKQNQPCGKDGEEKNAGQTTTTTVKIKTGWRRYIGIVLAIIATMSYSLGTLIVKICDHIHPFTLSFWRFQGILIPAIPLLLYSKYGLKKPVFETVWPATSLDKWKMIVILIVRSLIGCTSTICHISSLQYINMADASVIAFSCPVFVTLVAHLFLGERCGFTPLVISLLTFSGVVVITRPPMLTGGNEFDMDTLIGTGLAFASMVTASSVIILLRWLRSTHFSFMMTTYGLVGTIECVLVAYFYGVLHLPASSMDWIYGSALVFLTFLAQITLISALKYEEASPVALIQSSDVVFAFIWQFVFLNTVPDIISLTGSSIVVFGVVITTCRKWLLTLPDENATKRRFKFLLL